MTFFLGLLADIPPRFGVDARGDQIASFNLVVCAVVGVFALAIVVLAVRRYRKDRR